MSIWSALRERAMAKKTLRVALVMGGGVSLGAFSGGAISEVVRQLCCEHNQTYSEVGI